MLKTEELIQRTVAIKYRILGLQDPRDMNLSELIRSMQNDFDVRTLKPEIKGDSRTFKQKLIDKYYELYANDDLGAYKLSDGQLDTARLLILQDIRYHKRDDACVVPSLIAVTHYNERVVPSHTMVLLSGTITWWGEYNYHIDKAFHNVLFYSGNKVAFYVQGYPYHTYNGVKMVLIIQIFQEDEKLNKELNKLCDDFPGIVQEFIEFKFLDRAKSVYNNSYGLSFISTLPIVYDAQDIIYKHVQKSITAAKSLMDDYIEFIGDKNLATKYSLQLSRNLCLCTAKDISICTDFRKLVKEMVW